MFKSFLADESGATAIEYGFIALLISTAIVASIGLIGQSLSAQFTLVNDGLN